MKIYFIGDSLTKGVIGVSYVDFLKKKLSKYELINLGKNGDTVISLYRRLRKISFDDPSDIAFIWVGTNDVLVNVSWTFPLIKMLFYQPWTSECKKFSECYSKLLDLLVIKLSKIFVVSPLFIGEDMNNNWNSKLNELSINVEELSNQYNSVEFIDLRMVFSSKLNNKKISKYIANSTILTIFDEFRYKSNMDYDELSRKRGLHYTIDGIHLNSDGAKVVSDVFLDKIYTI